MAKQLLLGTTNQGKLAELYQLLDDLDWELLSLQDFFGASVPDVAETGSSFTENAVLKATTYATLSRLPTVAEDTGLEVFALDKFPGIYSDRWFAGTAAERNEALLSKMDSLTDRTAQFVNVVAFVDPISGQTHTETGITKGSITTEQLGTDGFGYDPVFMPLGYTQTFAQAGQEVKNLVSARALAVNLMKQHLQGI